MKEDLWFGNKMFRKIDGKWYSLLLTVDDDFDTHVRSKVEIAMLDEIVALRERVGELEKDIEIRDNEDHHDAMEN